jgi:hypothetical protein
MRRLEAPHARKFGDTQKNRLARILLLIAVAGGWCHLLVFTSDPTLWN